MIAFLVAGGNCDIDFLKKSYENTEYGVVIGIDGGAEYLYEAHIEPDFLVGDFDTLDAGVLKYYEEKGTVIDSFAAEKDETDTELGIMKAVALKCSEIHIFAGTGTRLDHVLGNIQSTMIAYEKGIRTYIIDKNNRIHIAFKHEEITKSSQYGKYVSFVSMTSEVTGVTLRGFKYPTESITLTNNKSLAISNQISEEKASLSYEDGVLLMIESKD